MRVPLIVFAALAGAALPADAQRSRGALGIDAARRGGVVIACRHAITDSADEDEMTLRYDDPSMQRRLSERGQRQAEALGRAFRALAIDVTEVIASPMQRAWRTGELAFGSAVQDSAWHTRGSDYSGPKRDRRIAVLGQLVSDGNRVIISHIGTMYSVLPSVRGELEEGDCVVVRPRGSGRHEVVEVVPWRAWLAAAGLDQALPDSRNHESTTAASAASDSARRSLIARDQPPRRLRRSSSAADRWLWSPARARSSSARIS
ncbi:MAG TPA: histidine phosphatase family protein [Gemmatimonadaceae bacterium]|nr:histidine phosphatase family protein [Gemmatimonadaceae bacterium]